MRDIRHKAIPQDRLIASQISAIVAGHLSEAQRRRSTGYDSQILPIADAHDHPIRSMDAPAQPVATTSCPCRRLCAGLLRTHRSSGEHTQGARRDRVSACAGLGMARSELSRHIPPPSAVQLVCIDADGERADYENSQGKRVDKPKFGNARLAVWTVGDMSAATELWSVRELRMRWRSPREKPTR